MVPSDTSGGSRDCRLPEGVVDDILAADRRRYALEALSGRETAMTIDDLAAAVRARERETTPQNVDPDQRRQVRQDLFQSHLPKLTATDVVRYDSVLGTVELADRETFADAFDGP